jgi:SAM-dependent methyltransferase
MSTFNRAQYDDLKVKSQDLYAAAKYAILEEHLRGQPPLRILNAGCGSGELSLRLAALGHSVLGIDPEPSYVELARQNAAAHPGLGCRFAVCSIEDYEGEGGFDCVVSTDVLEHVGDDYGAFVKLAGLVRPGGLVLLTVPAGAWLFGYHDEQLGHFRRYDRRRLCELVAGLCRVESVRYFGFTLVPVCLLYSKWLRRPYPVAGWGDASRRPLRALLLRALLAADRLLPLPLGTSLVLKGTRLPDVPGVPTSRRADSRSSRRAALRTANEERAGKPPALPREARSISRPRWDSP